MSFSEKSKVSLLRRTVGSPLILESVTAVTPV